MSRFLVISLIFIGLYSCKSVSSDNASISEAKKIVFNKDFFYPRDLYRIQILNANIEKDNLILDVRYGGGCKDHEFNLIFNEVWMKSMPPKISLYLEHKNQNDSCQAIMNKTLKFNIKKLKENSNEMFINMVGYSKQIKY